MEKSVAGIIIKNNKYLLGRRKQGGAIGGKWEFPGGKVEQDETLENALHREFLEEMGIKITILDYIISKDFHSSNHNFKLHAFYVELISDKIKYYEHDDFKWFTLAEISEDSFNLADSDKLLLPYLI